MRRKGSRSTCTPRAAPTWIRDGSNRSLRSTRSLSWTTSRGVTWWTTSMRTSSKRTRQLPLRRGVLLRPVRGGAARGVMCSAGGGLRFACPTAHINQRKGNAHDDQVFGYRFHQGGRDRIGGADQRGRGGRRVPSTERTEDDVRTVVGFAQRSGRGRVRDGRAHGGRAQACRLGSGQDHGRQDVAGHDPYRDR